MANVGRYWTAQRLRTARPAPLPAAIQAPDIRTLSSRQPNGRHVEVEGTAGWLGDGSTGRLPVSTAKPLPRPFTNLPERTNGKVFFTDGVFDYECSGTAVNSANKSMVWTAGHCVHGGPSGAFYRNWVFVPAYSSANNGNRPYGTWQALEMFAPNDWVASANPRQDLGAVVVSRRDGVRLVDMIGGQGISFNDNPTQLYSAYGYPAASPFNGFRPWRCDSSLLGRDRPPGTGKGTGPRTMKISCDMTAGASGGGWLRSISGGIGLVSSVNSYRYRGQANDLYGPYQGNLAFQLFKLARNRPV